MNQPVIAHLDMDAFFAAIEERENPQYRGLGIVVGADPKNGTGRGVVSTSNYQARKYGIHSAQPISQAWRLAKAAEKKGEPRTVFLPVNMEYYAEVSERIMQSIITLLNGYIAEKKENQQFNFIEQTSIDEAYIDLSSAGGFEKAADFIEDIRKKIYDAEKLTAKVGIGPNKLIAKMISAKAKPNTVSIILPQNTEKFLDPLSVREIPGVGPKTEALLNKNNIYKIADLKKASRMELKNWLGKWGEDIYDKARGIDASPVVTEREIKSVSEQETFDKDTLHAQFLLERLEELSEKVYERMKEDGIKSFKTVSITVRFWDFTTKSRAHTLRKPADSLNVLRIEATKLFLPFLDSRENYQRKLIRLLGVGIENFK